MTPLHKTLGPIAAILLGGLAVAACGRVATEAQREEARAFSRLVEPRMATADYASLLPVLEGGRHLDLPFTPPQDAWSARALTYRGRDYLVLVNPAGNRLWKAPDLALEPRWRALYAPRRDPREALRLANAAYYLNPNQVLVLESRLKPQRLLGFL